MTKVCWQYADMYVDMWWHNAMKLSLFLISFQASGKKRKGVSISAIAMHHQQWSHIQVWFWIWAQPMRHDGPHWLSPYPEWCRYSLAVLCATCRETMFNRHRLVEFTLLYIPQNIHFGVFSCYFVPLPASVKAALLHLHGDVIKWKHFPCYWPFVRGIHRSPVNSPQKGQWCGALMFSLICAWINGWVNNGEAGDLRRHRAHNDVIVMV